MSEWKKVAEGTFFFKMDKGTLVKSITVIDEGTVSINMLFVPDTDLLEEEIEGE